ncbi:MAG TPA: glycoside hydrolase family 38 C-terminal domain-containing protein, partial [Ktedonobacterales bacterium]
MSSQTIDTKEIGERTLLVVPHTHWDREWYLTFQQFRMKLVATVDAVLDIMERDPGYARFLLDGQTIILDDYLEVRPENAARLQGLAREGRILVGPWYIQPDEFLVSGESLVRNLLRGRKMARDYGGAMNVGYVPDTFGHIAQLPQILRGFGMETAVFWRGVGPEMTGDFRWLAPDGEAVHVVWLRDGYGNAANLPIDGEQLTRRAREIAARWNADNAYVLLMNGSDHLPPQAELPEMMRQANERLSADHLRLQIGTLPEYISHLSADTSVLPEYQGELRSSYRAPLLPATLSARVWLKQRNATCEAALSRWAEPVSALAWILGADYPAGFLDLAWKLLLQNQPHDSICGCSIDQVHAEMLPRYDQSEQVATTLTNAGLQFVAGKIKTRGAANAIPVMIFNPGPGPRTEVVEVETLAPFQRLRVTDDAGAAVPSEARLAEAEEIYRADLDRHGMREMMAQAGDGHIAGYTISELAVAHDEGSAMATVLTTLLETGEPDMEKLAADRARLEELTQNAEITTYRVVARLAPLAVIRLLARDVPAYGWRVFHVGPADTEPPEAFAGAVVATNETLENALLRISVDRADGSLTLYDKRTGQTYSGLNGIEDGGDIGDLYTYCPPATDTLISSPAAPPGIELVDASPLRATLRVTRRYDLPVSADVNRAIRADETATCEIVSDVTLAALSPRLDIQTTIHNGARDHRLRALFPTPYPITSASAEDTYAVINRPARFESASTKNWVEQPVNAHPQKRFVDVSDGAHGLAILNHGLAEYEIVSREKGDAVAVTLLRSVGWLSRGDLTTRNGHAGPMLATPGGQGLGVQTARYAILPHAGDWQTEGAVLREAQPFEAPLRALPMEQRDGELPASWSFVRATPDVIAISAIKRAESGDGLIVRLYNPGDQPQETALSLGAPLVDVREVRMDEEPLDDEGRGEIELSGNEARLIVGAGQIRTLRCNVHREGT